MSDEPNMSDASELSKLMDTVAQLENRVQLIKNIPIAKTEPLAANKQNSGIDSIESAAAEIRSRQASLALNPLDRDVYHTGIEKLHAQIKQELDLLKSDISSSLSRNITGNIQNELNELRGELVAIRNNVEAGLKGSENQSEIHNIVQGIQALQHRKPVEKNDIASLQEEINALRSVISTPRETDFSDDLISKLINQIDSTHVAVESLPSTRHLNSVESKINQVGDQLQSMLAKHAKMDTSILENLGHRLNELQATLVNVAERQNSQTGGVDMTSTQQGIEKLDARLSQLADMVKLQTTTGQPTNGIDSSKILSRLDLMSERLSKILNSSPVESQQINSLSSRVNEMIDRLDGIGTPNPNIPLELTALLNKLGEISQKLDVSDQTSLPALENHFQGLTEQIKHLTPHNYSKAMGAMSQSLAALAEKVNLVAEKANVRPNLDGLQEQIMKMHLKLDQFQSHGTKSTDLGDEATNRIERQIAALAGQLEKNTRLGPDPAKLTDLEDQISNIANLLSDSTQKANAFSGSIENAFEQNQSANELPKHFANLENQLANQSETLIEAVRNAAHDAAEQAVQKSPNIDNLPILAKLAQDLEALQSTTFEKNEGTRQTFEAVHETLEKIVDRLENLEVTVPAKTKRPATADTQDMPNKATQNDASLLDSVMEASGSVAGKFSTAPLKVRPVAGNTQPFVASNISNRSVETPIAPEIVPEQAPQPSPDSQNNSTVDGMDFIAAARRAAQSAATEVAQIDEKSLKQAISPSVALTNDDDNDHNDNLLSRLKHPVMLASGAILLALALYKFAPTVTGPVLATNTSNEPELVTLPENPDTPVREITTGNSDIASLDEIQTPQTDNFDVAKVETTGIVQPKPEKPTAELETIPEPIEGIGPAELRQAAISGNPAAMFEIALRYTNGEIVAKDLGQAAKWYELAGQRDLAPAQFRLGSLYENGIGVEKNINSAINWYEKAAKAGNARAMHNLAVLYAGPEGGSKFDRAIELFNQAADLGIQDSQFNLGILYGQGTGVELDLVESYKWFALASKAGDKEAAAKRDQVANAMLPEDLSKARIAVETWKTAELNENANKVIVPPEWIGGSNEKTAQSNGTDSPQYTSSVSGQNNDVVVNTQKILRKLGYKIGAVDGKAGPKTTRAIRDLQRQLGLEIDGRPSFELLEAVRSHFS